VGRRGRLLAPLFKLDYDLARLDRVAYFDFDGIYFRGNCCGQIVLHFHGFHHYNDFPRSHGLADGDIDTRHDSGYRAAAQFGFVNIRRLGRSRHRRRRQDNRLSRLHRRADGAVFSSVASYSTSYVFPLITIWRFNLGPRRQEVLDHCAKLIRDSCAGCVTSAPRSGPGSPRPWPRPVSPPVPLTEFESRGPEKTESAALIAT